MPECSLCGSPMPEEGGAVLFTDGRGVPFEVCGECEARFDTLRASRDEAAKEAAVDYIFGKAESHDRRGDIYGSLVEFVEACRPSAAAGAGGGEAAAEAEKPPEAPAPDANEGKRGFLKPGLFIAVIVALLLLALFLGGFHF